MHETNAATRGEQESLGPSNTLPRQAASPAFGGPQPEDALDHLSDDDAHVISPSIGFTAAQERYVQSLVGACALFFRTQKALFRKCNELRKLQALATSMEASEAKKLLQEMQAKAKVAENLLRPFQKTYDIVINDGSWEVRQPPAVEDGVDAQLVLIPRSNI